MNYLQEDNNSDLDYDDAAFTYFAATLLLVISTVLFCLVRKDFRQASIDELARLKMHNIFQKQIQSSIRLKRRIYKSPYFIAKCIMLIASLTLLCMIIVRSSQNRLKGFNPYEILGVSESATLKEVKFAYRKFAKSWHPDMKYDAAMQKIFIKMTAAYSCFGSKEKMENCLCYGSAEGQKHKKSRLSIALPAFLKDEDNQLTALCFLLLLLAFAATVLMLSIDNEQQDQSGLTAQQKQTIHGYMAENLDDIHSIFCLAEMGGLCEFVHEQPDDKDSVRLILQTNYPSSVLPEIDQYSPKHLAVVRRILTLRPDGKDAQFMLTLLANLSSFTTVALQFAQKIKNKTGMSGCEQLTIKYVGFDPILTLIRLARKLYHFQVIQRELPPLEANLRLSEEQIQSSLEQGSTTDFLHFLMEKNEVMIRLQTFAEERRQTLQNELDNIPIIALSAWIQIDGMHRVEIPTDETVEIHYKITKQRKNMEFCCAQTPFLKTERFYFVVLNKDNLIGVQAIVFEFGSLEYQGKFNYRQSVERNMKFECKAISDFYEGIDASCWLAFAVKGTCSVEDLPMHPKDKWLLKSYRSFKEEMAFSVGTEDTQLSESDEEDKEEEEEGEAEGAAKQQQEGQSSSENQEQEEVKKLS